MSKDQEYTVAFPGHDHPANSGRQEMLESDDAASRGAPSPTTDVERGAPDTDERPATLRMQPLAGPVPYAFRPLSELASASPTAAAISPVIVRLGTVVHGLNADGRPPAGSFLKLDRNVDDLVELCIGGDIVAYGRLVVANDKVAVQIAHLANDCETPETPNPVPRNRHSTQMAIPG